MGRWRMVTGVEHDCVEMGQVGFGVLNHGRLDSFAGITA
jgi:hypothetical protein